VLLQCFQCCRNAVNEGHESKDHMDPFEFCKSFPCTAPAPNIAVREIERVMENLVEHSPIILHATVLHFGIHVNEPIAQTSSVFTTTSHYLLMSNAALLSSAISTPTLCEPGELHVTSSIPYLRHNSCIRVRVAFWCEMCYAQTQSFCCEG
jgi:hypothetical protein